MGFDFDYWVTTDGSNGSQNPRIWQGNDAPAGRRQHQATCRAPKVEPLEKSRGSGVFHPALVIQTRQVWQTRLVSKRSHARHGGTA